MRLPVDAGFRLAVLALTSAALAGCGVLGGDDAPRTVTAIGSAASGPAADYPIVLGDPFTVDGEIYTPADTLNYDVVGYAGLDDGAGVTIASRTLPLPSYVEVTSLASGKTILARVERRGPMTGSQFVALSPAASEQLGLDAGGAVRVRRVNPLEQDRAELRAGRPASDRMETPKALVDVLRRKLPATGFASLRAPVAPKSPVAEKTDVATAPMVEVAPLSKPAPEPVAVAKAEPAPVAKLASVSAGEGFVVQAGTFSVRGNADKVAEALGGYVTPAGKFFRVRTGPFSNRGQADAALAKVSAAGYSDARVYSAG